LKRTFPQTAWSLVERAGKREPDALNKLLVIYLPVIRSYLIHVRRLDAQKCDDVIQGFIERCLLRGSLLTRADRQKGRFRNLLVTALNRYLVDQSRTTKIAAIKSLDNAEVANVRAPEAPDPFDTLWARQVVRLALDRAKEECITAGQGNYWSLFELRVLRPALDGVEPETYHRCVQPLGFTSVAAACNALVTVQRRLHRALREAIRVYESQSAVEDEIRDLRRILMW
jgi:hypothetical protein